MYEVKNLKDVRFVDPGEINSSLVITHDGEVAQSINTRFVYLAVDSSVDDKIHYFNGVDAALGDIVSVNELFDIFASNNIRLIYISSGYFSWYYYINNFSIQLPSKSSEDMYIRVVRPNSSDYIVEYYYAGTENK